MACRDHEALTTLSSQRGCNLRPLYVDAHSALRRFLALGPPSFAIDASEIPRSCTIRSSPILAPTLIAVCFLSVSSGPMVSCGDTEYCVW